MAFGVSGIRASAEPTPAAPQGTVVPLSSLGTGSGSAPAPMATDRVESTGASTNPNTYQDALAHYYGITATGTVAPPDHARKTNLAGTFTHPAGMPSKSAADSGHRPTIQKTEAVKTPDAVHGAHARTVSLLGTAGSFAMGLGEGAWDGGSGMVQSVGDLVKGGYHLATSSDARSHALGTVFRRVTTAADVAKTAATEPAKAAGQIVTGANAAWNHVLSTYEQAAANGNGAEFLGKAVGQGAVLAATLPIPGGAEADAAEAIADTARAAKVAAEFGNAEHGAANIGTAIHTNDPLSANSAAHGAGSLTEHSAPDTHYTKAGTWASNVAASVSLKTKYASVVRDAGNAHASLDLQTIEKGTVGEPHTLANHVCQNHTDRFAITKIDRTSTYTSLSSAQRSTDAIIGEPANQLKIGAWLARGANGKLALSGVIPGDPIGRTISRSDFFAGRPEQSTNNAKVVLQGDKNSPTGYTVLTSYPTEP